MSEQDEVVDVMFRVDRKDADDVYAIFPGLPGTDDPYTCTFYQHLGQHSGGDPHGCVQRSRPAKPEEYAALKAELEQIGYKLRVIHRMSRKHLEQRRKQLA